MIDLRISALSPGVHTFTLHPSPGDLDLGDQAFRDITVGIRLDLSDHQAHVTLRTSALAELVCDRTLVDFDEQVEGAHEVVFSAAAAHALDAGSEPTDDLLPLDAGQTSLDLTTPIRDTLMLSLPQRRIAPGAEDAEIPTTFGALEDSAGDVIDSRWQALLDRKNEG